MFKFGQLGHVGHLVDKDVVGTEVVMHQLGGVAVKVHQTLGYLTEDHDIVNEGKSSFGVASSIRCRLESILLIQYHDWGVGKVPVASEKWDNLRG